MSKMDIKITQVSKQEFSGLVSSQLVLHFKGKDVNSVVVNTLRRISIDLVPTYAFPSESITIERNTSIFNNDYMRLRLSQMTLPNIDVKPYFLEDKYWRSVDFRNKDRKKHPEDDKLIELYINAKNSGTGIMNVTSEHIKVYENGVEMGDKFDPAYPLLIVQLKGGEIFSCRCVGTLSIALNSNIWAASGNTYFEEVNDNEFILTLESQGQMDEYQILYKCCKILREKINIQKQKVKYNYDTPNIETLTKIKIELEGEDHTLGCIINEFLQNNKNVAFSGVSKPNLLIDNMIITFQTIKPNPLPIFMEALDDVLKLADEIESQIKKLGNKFIS